MLKHKHRPGPPDPDLPRARDHQAPLRHRRRLHLHARRGRAHLQGHPRARPPGRGQGDPQAPAPPPVRAPPPAVCRIRPCEGTPGAPAPPPPHCPTPVRTSPPPPSPPTPTPGRPARPHPLGAPPPRAGQAHPRTDERARSPPPRLRPPPCPPRQLHPPSRGGRPPGVQAGRANPASGSSSKAHGAVAALPLSARPPQPQARTLPRPPLPRRTPPAPAFPPSDVSAADRASHWPRAVGSHAGVSPSASERTTMVPTVEAASQSDSVGAVPACTSARSPCSVIGSMASPWRMLSSWGRAGLTACDCGMAVAEVGHGSPRPFTLLQRARHAAVP